MQPYTEPESLATEYLAGLPTDKLVDLLLHRTNLLMISTKNYIADPSYLGSLRNDLNKIYAAIRSRKNVDS